MTKNVQSDVFNRLVLPKPQKYSVKNDIKKGK